MDGAHDPVRAFHEHLSQAPERREPQVGIRIHLGHPHRHGLLDELRRDALGVFQLRAVALGEEDFVLRQR